MSLESIKSLVDLALKDHESGKAILKEYNGKQLPKEKSIEVDKLFDNATVLKAQADQEKKSMDLEKELNSPEYLHPLGNGETKSLDGITETKEQEKERVEFAKKSMRSYLAKGMDGVNIEERKALSSLSDPDGGILILRESRNEIIQKLRDATFIRQRATGITISGASVAYPTFEDDDLGANTEIQECENIRIEDITDVFGEILFTPHKDALIYKIPQEMLEDSEINIESFMNGHFATRFAEREEEKFLNGLGVKEPRGVLQSNILALDIDGIASAISAEDIYTAIYGMRAVYRNRSSWMLNRVNISKIRKIRDDSGAAAGTGQFMWQMGLAAGEPSTLAGFPIQESEFFPTNVDDGDAMLLFGDWSTYWIVDRTSMSFQRLNETFAVEDKVGIKMRKRTDGKPTIQDAFIRLNQN